ncbi:MAG: tetratricopeptide repeat protein [Pyrinomonadaceae bacterium]
MLRRLFFVSFIMVLTISAARAQTASANAETVMVLPFENASKMAEFNWVGESFADSLSDLLHVPTLNVVSNDERKIIQQRLRIPLTSLPSLATSLKLAREANASLLITGKYNIVPAQGDIAATINVTAKIIRVNEGRFLNEELPDGRRITRDINLNDALGNLQTMQGQIAYQILYQRDKALPFSQNELIVAANKVPARAFEAYIKGLLTTAPDARENYFKNALRLFNEVTPDATYSDAALELGHLYLGQKKYPESIDAFERVVNTNLQCKDKAKADYKPARCNDEGFAEASFYIGLIQWQQGNYEPALAVLRPLAEDLKLTSVYNALGAIAVQASRAEKKNAANSSSLLAEGIDFLKKATDSSPDDLNVRFNYALASFLNGGYAEAATNFRSILSVRVGDGEASYLLAKALGEMKDAAAQSSDDEARRLLSVNNRYANLEKEWLRAHSVGEINLRVDQPLRQDFVSVVLSRQHASPTAPQLTETDALLAQARAFYKNGNDDEAMAVLRRVLAGEPMSAESYLILGKIHLRRGDMDQATSSFKTAIFWDNRLVDAHVSLGKIFFEKGDCLQAKTYAASAAEIDPENQDVLALQRQADRCSK